MGLRTVVLTGLAMLVAAAPAQAATFTVTTTADTVGATGCTAVLCTVRTALAAAAGNGATEDDVIELPAGAYTLDPQRQNCATPSSGVEAWAYNRRGIRPAR